MTDLIQAYEEYIDVAVPERVRAAQRAMLLHFTQGLELWQAAARAMGVDPSVQNDLHTQERCLRIAMRWLDDPGIEKATDQIHRVANATLRMLRMQAMMVLGRTMHRGSEHVQHRTAVDVLKATEHLGEMEGSIPVGGESVGEAPAPANPRLKIGSEAARLRLRALTKKRLEGGKPGGD